MIGETEQAEPDWGPLLQHLDAVQIGDWFWMSRERVRGRWVEQYKHRDTKDYVCLDQQGRAWRARYTVLRGRRKLVRANAAAEIAKAYRGAP
jgi:hypothetical protein